MDKQMINPPDTWNDEKAIRESFRLWFGWYGWKEARASFGAFRRGYMSGAIAASIEMWNWIQSVVFRQETEKRAAGPEEELPMMTEREQQALNMIIEISDWLSGTAEAAATEQPGVILSNACETGTKYLESIGEYLKTGKAPAWYKEA